MLLKNRYEYNPLTDFIADGSAARVYIAYDNQTDKPVIVKFYHALSVEHQTFQSNMERIKQLSHPNITHLHDYFVLETINYLGQMTEVKVGIWEYIPNGILQLPLASPETEKNLRGIIAGLQYLYANNCAHHDLNLDNILISTQGEVKLNNYEITNTSPEQQPDKSADLRGIGEVLHQYCTGEMPKDNFPEALQSDIREVYSVIIQDCLLGKAKSVEEVLLTLNEYERNKRFAEVLPLQTKQAQTRYVFEMDDDLLEDTHHSYIFKAFDNLLDETVTLEIFKDDPSVALLHSIDKSKYTYLFKLNLPDESETYKTALAGILIGAITSDPSEEENQAAVAPENTDDAELEALTLTNVGSSEVHTGDTAVIEVAETEFAKVEETEEETKPEKDTATFEEPLMVQPEVLAESAEDAADTHEEMAETTHEEQAEGNEQADDTLLTATDEVPDKEAANENGEDIRIISITDHVAEPEAGSPHTDMADNSISIEHIANAENVETNTVTEEVSKFTDDLPIVEDDQASLLPDENTPIDIEFETIDLTETGDNPEDVAVNTEVIVQKAIEEVNADFGKDLQELEAMKKEVEESIANINFGDTGIQENTGSIAPTGLIKVEALSELHKDIETSEKNTAEPDDTSKDKYIDVAINTLKNDDEPATDTQYFEKEAMEQVKKDLEKLLSDDEDVV